MRHRCQGFTLLELMIVIVLIGVLLGMVSFAVGPNPARQARQDAQALVGLIQQLRERAVLEGREYGIHLSRAGYRAMHLAQRRWEPLTSLQRWPQNLDVRVEQDGHPLHLGGADGAPQLLMLSSDETNAFALTFVSGDKTVLGLSSDGIGEVQIDD